MHPRTPISNPDAGLPGATIVLVLRDEQHLVDGALDSLLQQSGGPYRIRVIDDGSIDGTWDRIVGVLDRRGDTIHDVRSSRYVEPLGVLRVLEAIGDADTECVVVARPEDRSRADRVVRLLHAM